MDETVNTLQGMKNVYPPTGIGARLKAAREALHLSEKEVAARLRLNTRYIHMMENETFESNLPDTFLRGYFRSYARLLNFNESDITAAIAQINIAAHPPEAAVVCAPAKRNIHQLDRYLRWMSYGIIFLLGVLVIFWWASHPRDNETDLETKTTAQEDLPLPSTVTNTSITVPKLTPTQVQAAAPSSSVAPSQHPIAINSGEPEAKNTVKQPNATTTPIATISNAATTATPDTPTDTLQIATKQKPKPSTLDTDEDDSDSESNSEDIY